MNSTVVYLSKVATVGCSLSLLFSSCTFVVLGFLKKRSISLRIKHHFTFCFFLVNVITLSFRSSNHNDVSCRFTTIVLQYILTVLFGWNVCDNYYLLTYISLKRSDFPFLKVFMAVWGFPLLFTFVGVILGFTLKSKLGSGFYNCWRSDHVIWGLVVPCTILTFVSLILSLFCLTKVYWKVRDLRVKLSMDSIECVRYFVHTNIIHLCLLLITWICGFMILWFPDEEVYQTIFGVSNTIQGVFMLFFYCIFYSELFHFNKDNTFTENTSHDVTENLHTKEQSAYSNEVDVQRDVNLYDAFKEEDAAHGSEDNIEAFHENNESVQNIQTVTGTEVNETDSKITETTVLVHSPAIKPSSADTEQTVDKKLDLNGNNELLETANTDVIDSSIPEGEDKKKLPGIEKRNRKQTSEQFNTGSTTNVLDKIKEETPSTSHTDGMFDDASIESTHPARRTSPTRTFSSTSFASRKSSVNDRGQRATSQTSNVSFNSQMGMNELESLFNNPDLLSQANWKNRKRSSQTHSPNFEQREHEKIRKVTPENNKRSNSPPKRTKRESRNEFFDFN